MKQKIIIELDKNIEDISKWFIEDAGDYLINAVKNGTPIPKKITNVTNGDVIKALFPDIREPHFYGMKEYMYDTTWWNEPYKGVE